MCLRNNIYTPNSDEDVANVFRKLGCIYKRVWFTIEWVRAIYQVIERRMNLYK